MEVIVTKSDIHKLLSLTQVITEKKSTMPVLANVLLQGKDGTLIGSATDLEISTTVTIPAEVKQKGGIAVNGKILGDIVRELPDGAVNLSLTQGEILEVNAARSRLRIRGVPADEYPTLEGLHLKPQSQVKASQLLNIIQRTVYAASTDETCFYLNGVNFENDPSEEGEGFIRAVATDGHRLSLSFTPWPFALPDGSKIVSRRSLQEIRKALEVEGDGEVGVLMKEGFFLIEGNIVRMVVKFVDAEFPKYSQVIPKKKGNVMEVEASKLEQALRRVSLMIAESMKSVKFDLSKDFLKITSSSPDVGDAYEEVLVSYNGPEMQAAFNARYILDFIASLPNSDKKIRMELQGPEAAVKLSPLGDDSYFGIVMPIRLESDD